MFNVGDYTSALQVLTELVELAGNNTISGTSGNYSSILQRFVIFSFQRFLHHEVIF